MYLICKEIKKVYNMEPITTLTPPQRTWVINIENKDVLTAFECCLYMGISEKELKELTRKKLIKYSKPGGKLRYFDRQEINKYLLQNSYKTIDEINTEANSYSIRRKF